MNSDRFLKSIVVIAILLGLHWYLPVLFSAQEDDNAIAHDRQVIAEVRREVEALPKDKRLVVGTEIQRGALKKLKTTRFRQRAMISLGDLYEEQGKFEESAQFYSEGIDLDPSSRLAAYGRLRAASVFQRLGQEEQATRLMQEHDVVRNPDGDGKDFLDLNVVAAKIEAMIGEERFDEVITYCVILSRKFPSDRDMLLSCAEKVPLAFRRQAKHEEAITWYETIRGKMDAATSNPNFASNYITALKYCDDECNERQSARIRSAIDEFAKSFPNHSNVPIFFAAYADTSLNAGQIEIARAYYKKAIEHPKVPAEVKRAITRVLTRIDSNR